MKKTLPYFLVALFWVLSLSVRASHILGGEIKMETSGQANQYSITMIQFWDQAKLTVANQDPWVELLFYRKRDNALIYKHRIPLLSTEKVAYQNDVCTQLRSLDSRVGTYNGLVMLNPGDFNDPEGYYIVWERCCRNAAISNIRSPGESGLVFYLEFPPLSIRNTSPIFNGPNGDYICKDVPYSTNAGATDADGDELRYSLVAPFRGYTTEQDPDGTDSPKLGYPLVEWSAGNSAQNAIPGNPPLTIDARTGQLTVTANQLGLFVFTVLCEEYRNGKRIGAVRRDYQSLVIECNPPPPAPVIVSDAQTPKAVEICEGKSKSLEIIESGDWTYQWYRNEQMISGATAPKLEAREAGTYKVIKSPRDQQCTGTATSQPVEVVLRKPPSAVLIQSKKALCEGESLALTAAKNDNYVYEWRQDSNLLPESSSTLSVKEAGDFSIVVRDKVTGCTARDSAVVKLDTSRIPAPIVLQNGLLTQKVEFCSGSTVRLEVQSPGDWGYQWYLNGNEIQGGKTATLSVGEMGNYTVVRNFKDQGYCAGPATSQPVESVVGKTPSATIARTSEILCNGETVALKAEANASYDYKWSFNNKKTTEVNSTILARQGGLYQLTITDKKNNCSASDSVSIVEEKIEVVLPNNTIVRRGENIMLNPAVNSTTQSVIYLWSPSVGLDDPYASKPIASVNQTTSYVLLATTPGGCTATDTVKVIVVDRVYVPDAFSPNGDGINDFLMLSNGKELIEKIRIYDRWGSLVYFSNDYETPWDGKYNGSKVPSGVYTFIINTSFENYKGSIMVLY